MKHRSKTSFLLKFLTVLTLAACIFNPGLKAEWGVDQVLEVQIFDAPKGLPENVYYLEHQIRYQGSLEDGLAVGEGRLFWNNGQVLYEGSFAAGLFEGKGIYRDRNGFRIYEGNSNRAGFMEQEHFTVPMETGLFTKGCLKRESHVKNRTSLSSERYPI